MEIAGKELLGNQDLLKNSSEIKTSNHYCNNTYRSKETNMGLFNKKNEKKSLDEILALLDGLSEDEKNQVLEHLNGTPEEVEEDTEEVVEEEPVAEDDNQIGLEDNAEEEPIEEEPVEDAPIEDAPIEEEPPMAEDNAPVEPPTEELPPEPAPVEEPVNAPAETPEMAEQVEQNNDALGDRLASVESAIGEMKELLNQLISDRENGSFGASPSTPPQNGNDEWVGKHTLAYFNR